MKESKVYSEEILVCNECNDKVEECWNCGDGFEKGDTIYCDMESGGSGHYCEKCSELKGIDF